jgi:uncharacterized protein
MRSLATLAPVTKFEKSPTEMQSLMRFTVLIAATMIALAGCSPESTPSQPTTGNAQVVDESAPPPVASVIEPEDSGESVSQPAPDPDPVPATSPTTPPPVASANPSFACEGSLSSTETLICNDAQLARLDRQVSRSYAAALRTLSGTARANLVASQRTFLADRDRCPAAACVARAYRQRSQAIEAATAAKTASCESELGKARADRLVRQCLNVSPATRPPCNVANSCAMIQSEIERGCGLLPRRDRPDYCRSRQ